MSIFITIIILEDVNCNNTGASRYTNYVSICNRGFNVQGVSE